MIIPEVFSALCVILRMARTICSLSCNFTPMARPDYRVGVPKKKQYRLVLNSDAAEFGGSGKEQPEVYRAVQSECDGRPYSFAYDLPAYGVAVFKF